MKIKEVMKNNPITVDSEALVLDALRIMKENGLRALPVIDKNKLVGVVTYRELNEAIPYPSSLSKAHESHSLSQKMKVKDIVKKSVVTLSQDTPFEEGLRIGQQKGIIEFPVVDESGKLVGIFAESDIIRVLTRVLGLGEEGSKITVEGLGRRLGDDLQKIVSIVNKFEIALLSIMSLPRPEKGDSMIMLRLKTEEPGPIVNDLRNAGFSITYIA